MGVCMCSRGLSPDPPLQRRTGVGAQDGSVGAGWVSGRRTGVRQAARGFSTAALGFTRPRVLPLLSRQV